MHEAQGQHDNAGERRKMNEVQESEQRAQARERVRVAQERERQERKQRASASRTRAQDRAVATRATAARATVAEGAAPARSPVQADAVEPAQHTARAAAGSMLTSASTLSVQDVVDLFNHPLGEGEMRRAWQALAADTAWSLVPEEESADRLTCVLVHQPSGTRVQVAQERSLVGIWNSRI
jgi:hypothetical protein